MKTEHSSWFLVYTKAKEEKRAKKNLENQGFETFLPWIAYKKINQSKTISLEVMFPRYLFTKINPQLDDWTLIKSTRGVNHLIFFGQNLAKVPNQVIELIKSRTDENDVIKQRTTRREFQKGEKLFIKKGIFKGIEATFLSRNSKERVRILLRFVNQLATAEIPSSNVGKKEIVEAFKI